MRCISRCFRIPNRRGPRSGLRSCRPWVRRWRSAWSRGSSRAGWRRYTPLEYTGILQTVVETPAFLSEARSLGLPDAERLAIVSWIAANPAIGEVIEGTGGARKVRFGGKGKG